MIDSIEEYIMLNGRAPDKLTLLIPEYLSEIPRPSWGVDRWEYVSTGGKGFALSVRLGEGDYICHIYENGEWWYDQ